MPDRDDVTVALDADQDADQQEQYARRRVQPPDRHPRLRSTLPGAAWDRAAITAA